MHETMITGMRATGIPHIGNYLGSIKPIMELQDKYQIFQLVADLHAIPHIKDPLVLNENVRTVTACYLACGLNTEKTIIWRQSQMNEMGWVVSILSTLTTAEEMDQLMDRKNNHNLDILSYMYPILMAADTLMIDADCVFAGIDHKTGMEFIQKLASRYNTQYGQLLRVPKPVFPSLGEMVKGIDGRKMSKSFHNTITILETEANLYEMIMNSKLYETVSEADTRGTILHLLSLFISEKEFKEIQQNSINNEISSTEIRSVLFTSINNEIAPIRERYDEIMKKPELIDNILCEGLIKVKTHTANKLQKVLQQVGFAL